MGCGVTFTSCVDGAAPVIPPAELVGNTTCDMKTFQVCWLWLLGSTCLSEPYQTASARPGPPALIHGKTLVASPVAVVPSLTWTGRLHTVQPVDALDALTKTWRSAGVPDMAHTANRFRPVSIDTTENSVSGEPVGVSAILISRVRSW